LRERVVKRGERLGDLRVKIAETAKHCDAAPRMRRLQGRDVVGNRHVEG